MHRRPAEKRERSEEPGEQRRPLFAHVDELQARIDLDTKRSRDALTNIDASLDRIQRRNWEFDQARQRALMKKVDQESRRYYEKARNTQIDNARKILVEPPIDRKGGESINPVGMVQDLRTFGRPRTARMLYSLYTPPHGELTAPESHWDPFRKMYQCPNCHTYATHKMVKETWFNIGYSDLDWQIGFGMFENDWSTRVRARRDPAISWNEIEPRDDPFHLIPPPMQPGAPTVYVNDYLHDYYSGVGFTVPRPEQELPAVFVCSQRCADEQAKFNYIRNNKHKQVRKVTDMYWENGDLLPDEFIITDMARNAPDSMMSEFASARLHRRLNPEPSDPLHLFM
jgi:hypothetical protein